MGAFLWPCALLHLELIGPVVFSLLGQQEMAVAQIDHSEVSIPSLAMSSICLTILSVYPSIHPPSIIRLSTCPPIHACIIQAFTQLFIHLPVYPSICPSVSLLAERSTKR